MDPEIPPEEHEAELQLLRREVQRLRQALNRVTPRLQLLLRRRGFTVFRKEPDDDLLIPGPEYIDDYYRMLHRYSFRLFLRDVIKLQAFFTAASVARFATALVTAEYAAYLERIGLVISEGDGYRLFRHFRSFGVTLEWYLAEILQREFGAEVLWGVKFKRPRVGGDYDVIARVDGQLLYAEVKSSPPRQIFDREVAAFLQRVSDLSPDIAIFLVDTELRMKDKIVPMFEAAAGRGAPVPVRLERELFQIPDRTYIINAKPGIARNIAVVLDRYFRRLEAV